MLTEAFWKDKVILSMYEHLRLAKLQCLWDSVDKDISVTKRKVMIIISWNKHDTSFAHKRPT